MIDHTAILRHWTGHTSTGTCWNVYNGHALSILQEMPSQSFDCVVTSPPYYWLRDYGVEGQIGHEETVQEYVDALGEVMHEVHRVLKNTGLLFLNIGDTYYSGKGESQGTDLKNKKRRFGKRAVDKSGGLGIGIERKSLIGIPWRVAFGIQHRTRWSLRSAIVWYREKYLAESVEDRPRRKYEHVFMFSKDRHYYFNRQPLVAAGQEDVWAISTRPKSTNGVNTAPFPDELVERCLAIGCVPEGGVLDPFAGSGTTLRVALDTGRSATGIDLSYKCCKAIVKQLNSRPDYQERDNNGG